MKPTPPPPPPPPPPRPNPHRNVSSPLRLTLFPSAGFVCLAPRLGRHRFLTTDPPSYSSPACHSILRLRLLFSPGRVPSCSFFPFYPSSTSPPCAIRAPAHLSCSAYCRANCLAPRLPSGPFKLSTSFFFFLSYLPPFSLRSTEIPLCSFRCPPFVCGHSIGQKRRPALSCYCLLSVSFSYSSLCVFKRCSNSLPSCAYSGLFFLARYENHCPWL